MMGRLKKMIEFLIPMKPPVMTDQQYSIRAGKSDSPVIANAKTMLKAQLIHYRPEHSLTCGIRLTVKWFFPKGIHSDGKYCISNSAANDLQKILKDCMSECGFWQNDALVCSELCEKLWSAHPGVYVRIEEVA